MAQIKTLGLLFLCLCFFSCKENTNKATEQKTKTSIFENSESFIDKSFNEIFTEIQPEEISDNVFKLFSVNNCVLTSGREDDFNSMIIASGGFGYIDRNNICWTTLRATRYTLEYINEHKTYTFSFFEDKYKDEYLKFGKLSGRDSDKMKDTKLTAVSTASGRMTFKEARLVIECELVVNSPYSFEYYIMPEDGKFYQDAYESIGKHHRFILGRITKVWIK